MPADDLVLNVRQIAGYTPTSNAPSSASILMQLSGLGSAYASISPQALVATALASPGGDMAIGGLLSVAATQGASAAFSNLTTNILAAQRASIVNLAATFISMGGSPVATQADLAATVTSFMGRTGAVNLWIDDILAAGGAPIFSPVFGGCPRAPTPDESSNNSRLATTAFVQRNAVIYIQNLLDEHPFVFTFNGRSGEVVLTEQDILAAGGGTVFDSVALTGVPTAPTAPVGTNTTQIATTAFVINQINASTQFAPINSPVFTGIPSGPTAPVGTQTGQLATTAFVANAVQESTTGVASFNGRVGNVTLGITDIINASGAPLASPAFVGTPTAPTAAPGTANNEIATTAFVAALGGVASFNTRTGAVVLTSADIAAVGGAALNSPAFIGNPTAPTPAPGDNDTSIATTAFVMAALIASSVSSFNGRVGNVTLNSSDISAAGGAPSVSPAFTGTPTAPTPAPGTNTPQLATTAYVMAALAAGGGVVSFNGRAGAVVLTNADVIAALPASTLTPLMNGTAAIGIDTGWSHCDHIHPVDTSRYAASNPSGFQTAAQVTASLANYLPLTGGNVTGSISVSANLTGNNINATTSLACNTFVARQGIVVSQGYASAPSPAFTLWNTAGAVMGNLSWQTSNGAVQLANNFSGGGTAMITITPGFQINSASFQPGGGTWSNSSDARIKDVEGDYTLGLSEILQLQPIVYRYKGNDTDAPPAARSAAPYAASQHRVVADKRTAFVGLIAQEVEPIFPGMVTKRSGFIDGEPVDDIRDINTTELTFALVNAIKTLAARVAALEGT
jgi:hypothetical protein